MSARKGVLGRGGPEEGAPERGSPGRGRESEWRRGGGQIGRERGMVRGFIPLV